jgi:hypothetical protein
MQTVAAAAEENKLYDVSCIPFPLKTLQVTCVSRRRPMDTSEYALKHGTFYRLGPKTSKRARRQAVQAA